MKTIDIIEGLNQYFTNKYPNKGFFISKQQVLENTTVKAYKTYIVEVYYKKDKFKEKILDTQVTFNTSRSSEAAISKDLTIKLTKELFSIYDKIEQYGIQ